MFADSEVSLKNEVIFVVTSGVTCVTSDNSKNDFISGKMQRRFCSPSMVRCQPRSPAKSGVTH